MNYTNYIYWNATYTVHVDVEIVPEVGHGVSNRIISIWVSQSDNPQAVRYLCVYVVNQRENIHWETENIFG